MDILGLFRVGAAVALAAALAIAEPACGQVNDDALSLGAVITGRSSQEGTKRAVYKIAKMQAADVLFNQDKPAALKLLGINPPTIRGTDQSDTFFANMNESQFLEQYSSRLDDEIKGQKFGDVFIGKIAKVAVLGVAAYATDGLALLEQLGAKGLVQIGTNELVDNILISSPLESPSIEGSHIYEFSTAVSTLLKEDTPLTPLIQNDFKTYMDIGDIAALKRSPEYRTFLEENDLEQTESTLANFKGSVAEKLQRLSDLTDNNRGLLLDLRKLEDDEARQSEAIAQKRKELEENQKKIETVGMALSYVEALGQMAGLSNRQMTYVRGAVKIADSLYTALNSTAENPMTYMGGYFAVFVAVISIVQAEQQQDAQASQTDVIMGAMRRLAEQIDGMHTDMINRFTLIDNSLAMNFALQESLLDAILRYEKNETEELTQISSSIERSRDQLREALDAYAERQREALWAECLSIPSGEQLQDQLRQCRNNAELMAIKWSYDAASVASDFDSMFPLNSTNGKLVGSGFTPVFEFSKVIPLYGQLRFDDRFKMPNPMAWMWGAGLMSYLVGNQPYLLRSTTSDDIKSIVEQGRLIQQFYRRLFADEQGQLDIRIVTNLANLYESSLANYTEAVATKLAELQLPLLGPTQSLPEEILPLPSQNLTMAKIMLPPNKPWSTDIVNFSSDSRVADDRQKFNGDLSGKKFSLLTTALKGCSAFSPKYEWATDWDRDIAVNEFVAPDVNNLKARGMPIDASILGLIPREALWMEHLDPRRFHVGACVSELTGFSYGTDNPGPFVVTAIRWGYRITISFYLTDNNTRGGIGQIPIGSAKTSVRIYTPTFLPRNMGTILVPILSSSWSGSTIAGMRVGPIFGHFEDYFAPNPATSEEATNLMSIRQNVELLKNAAIDDFLHDQEIGPVKAVRDEANQKLRVLKGLRLLNIGKFPEVDQALDVVDTQFTKPEYIVPALVDGFSVDQIKLLLKQQQEALTRVQQMAGPPSDTIPDTPVDRLLDDLGLSSTEIVQRESSLVP